jgi:hypothetical protein
MTSEKKDAPPVGASSLADICRLANLAYRPTIKVEVPLQKKQEEEEEEKEKGVQKKRKPSIVDLSKEEEVEKKDIKKEEEEAKCLERCRIENDPDIERLLGNAPVKRLHYLCQAVAGQTEFGGNVANIWKYGTARDATNLTSIENYEEYLTPHAQAMFNQSLANIQGVNPKIQLLDICNDLKYKAAFAGLCGCYQSLARSKSAKALTSATTYAQIRSANGQDIQQYLGVFWPSKKSKRAP